MIHMRKAIIGLVLVGTVLLAAEAGAQRSTSAKSAAPANAPTLANLERQREREQIEHEKLKLEVERLRAEIDKLKAETGERQINGERKRAAEIAKLEAETRNLQPWYGPLLGVVVGFAGIVVTGWFGFKTAMKARLSTFDMKLYEERLKAYGNMIAATKALAMHFPERLVDQDVCARTGRLLRAEFFGLTGSLLTVDARNRYMTLSHALTRATRAERLNVPSNDDDYAKWISEAQVDKYRRILGLTVDPDGAKLSAEHEMKRCAKHQFGHVLDATLRQLLAGESNPDDPCPTNEAAARLFQDYVVLQFASSRLRTELGHDVSGRRPLVELAEGVRAPIDQST